MKKALIISFLVLFVSCEKNTDSVTATSKEERAIEILHEQGFNTDGYKVSGDDILIDNCILIPIDEILDGTLKKQWQTEYLISQEKVKNIKVKIESNVPEIWKEATRFALKAWSGITNTKLNMVEVTENEDIVIRYTSLENSEAKGAIAVAKFPTKSGDPGNLIKINTIYNEKLSQTQKNLTIVHELGHCIGFRHTNWFDRNSDGRRNDNEGLMNSKHVPGTPKGYDEKSVMNALIKDWTGFSENDEISVRYFYPEGDITNPPTDDDDDNNETPVDQIQKVITGPDFLNRHEYGTFKAPKGSSYEWWYQLGWRWFKFDPRKFNKQEVNLAYYRSYVLAVKVDGKVYTKLVQIR
jgi:hypothetical protein